MKTGPTDLNTTQGFNKSLSRSNMMLLMKYCSVATYGLRLFISFIILFYDEVFIGTYWCFSVTLACTALL